MERIVAAAVLFDDVIHSTPRPGRHHTIMHALAHADWDHWQLRGLGREKQGFLTSEGRFVDRTEGAAIARAAGQLESNGGELRWPPILYSEDLW